MGQQPQVSVSFINEYNTLQCACQTEGYTTRNSAIADKPRDAFVQYTMAWLTPKHARPSSYAEFNRPTSKGVGINIEEPRKFWSAWAPPPCDRKVAVPLENAPFQHVLPCRNYSFRSNGKSVITEIRLQNLTPRVPPFKVTQCRWN